MRAVKIMACALALTALLAPGARADESNKLTYLTFSAPVQLPGITLPAGTYAFKLADSWSNRHIVQVFDKEQGKIYGTFLTVSDQKLDPPDKPLVMFRESPAGTPNAVRAWFYPGDTIGDEFVYPKDQAVKIAKATHQPVMATADDMSNADATKMHGAKVGHVDENGAMISDDNDNRADATASAATRPQAAGASGTTGAYTAAPRESDHRTGVSENGDAMNRYNANAQAAGNRTANPNMAAGGETVTSQTGTTASANSTAATGTTAQAGAPASTKTDRSMRDSERHAGTTAVGTSGQADTAAGTTANAKGKRHLPRTASPLGAIGLLSGLSLAGAFGVRQLRKRVAGAR